jgi:hypothetical protein
MEGLHVSDSRIGEIANRIAGAAVSEAVAYSYGILEALTKAEHRGRGDTWEAARNRAAKRAGIPLSYAARLWHRWKDMRGVSGDVLLALQKAKAAYDASCTYHETRAAELRAERLGERIAMDTRHAPASLGARAAAAEAAAEGRGGVK